MKLILLGAPGAGKGTQGIKIEQALNIPTISTGNILRSAIKEQTKLGMEAKNYMDSGLLVPDELILGIVKERLSQSDCEKGYILDGVPRTIAQAEYLETLGIEIDKVLVFQVADESIITRMAGRRTCEGCGASYHVAANPPKEEGVCDVCGKTLIRRKDDAPETVAERLKVYHATTEALIEFYSQRGKVFTVPEGGNVDEIWNKVKAILGI